MFSKVNESGCYVSLRPRVKIHYESRGLYSSQSTVLAIGCTLHQADCMLPVINTMSRDRKRRDGRLALRSRPPAWRGRGAGWIQLLHEAARLIPDQGTQQCAGRGLPDV